MTLLTALFALAPTLFSDIPRAQVSIPGSGLRVLVLERNDRDAAEWVAIRNAGANVVATLRTPSLEADELAGAAGLTYLAFFTTDEIFTFAHDAAQIAEARSERNLAGFYFWDAQVVEGFTSPRAQEQAYSTLKLLFPDKLVLYPTRLDPIAWDPRFLDDYFRPQFTDLVTPYFYPVGTTIIGEAGENDPWKLDELLSALAERVPAGKDILPVLQGFEQVGYPVGTAFLQKQFAIYRHHWPTLRNVAVYAWRLGGEGAGSLVEIAGRSDLEQGVCHLFRSLSRRGGCRSDREIPFR